MKVLVLGAGAVGTVSALKFVQDAMLEQLVIADAVSARASLLADRLGDPRVSFRRLDAGDRIAVADAIRETGTTILLNAALPATNLEVMHACLAAGCHYIDMASGGTDDDGIPKLDDQFALDAEFKAAGRIALLGMGADPGTSNVYAAYAAKHLLDEVTELRVRDGDNSVCQGHDGFVATFSPWVFIDECLCKAVSYRDGRYHLEPPLTGFEPFDFPELGVLNCYYVDHEESRTLPKYFPSARLVDFKLCMDDVTIETLRVMQRLGLSGKDRIQVGDTSVVPRDVVVSLLPEPKDLAGKMRGKTCVGTLARGFKDWSAAGLLHLQRRRPRVRLRGARGAGHGLSDGDSTGHRRPADSRRPLERRGRALAGGVRSRSVSGSPLAGGHALARPGRHRAGRSAEGPDPAVTGDRGGLSACRPPMLFLTTEARRTRRSTEPDAHTPRRAFVGGGRGFRAFSVSSVPPW